MTNALVIVNQEIVQTTKALFRYHQNEGRGLIAMAFLVGAFLGTFTMSRLLYLTMRNWPGYYGKALVVNLLAGAIIVPWAAIGLADGGPARVADSFAIYGLCALLLAAGDVIYAAMTGRAPFNR